MKLVKRNGILRGKTMRGKRIQQNHNKWLATFSKKAVALILAVSLIDLQLSYILAFIGKEQIAETLSSTITETIVGVMLGYFLKALFETFFEKREERLNKTIEGVNHADLISDDSFNDDFCSDECYGGSDQETVG